MFAAADTSPKLMQLRKTEAFRIFDDHDGGIGNVHANFDDGGGNQNVGFMAGEGGHDGFLFFGLHFSVHKSHFQIGENLRLQHFCIFRHGFSLVGQFVIHFHHGADDVGLSSFGHKFADEVVQAGMIAGGDGIGFNRLSAGRKLINDRNIQIAVKDQCQRTGNRCSRHDKGMGMLTLIGKRGALSNAETMLFVGDHKAQICKFYGFCDQCVGADGKVDFAGGQLGRDGTLGCGFGRAGQQRTANSHGFQQRCETVIVLLGKDFGRRHQCGLPLVFYHEVHAGSGHHGFTGADVTLTKTVHGRAGTHIGQCFLNAAPLGVGESKGKRIIEFGHVYVGTGPDRHGFPTVSQPFKADRKEEQLLEGQTAPGQIQSVFVFGKMNVFIGIADAAEMMVLSDFIGKNVRKNLSAGIQSLTDGTGENQLRNAGGQGVDGNDAAGEFSFSFLLHNGRGHGFAEKVSLGFSIKNIGFSLLQLVFQPGLIEKGDIENTGFIDRPDLHQIHAFADVRNCGRRGNHGGDTGVFVGNQIGNTAGLAAVIVFPGKPRNQIAQVFDAKFVQSLGALFADSFDIANVSGQISHIGSSSLVNMTNKLYHTL